MKRFIPPRLPLLLVLAASLVSATLAQTCNRTEYYIYDNKDATSFVATRANRRCDGVPCLYHSDCQSGFCLKRDLISTVDVEGVCIRKTPQYENCNLTYGNINTKSRSNQQQISMNRCEFVPCLYD